MVLNFVVLVVVDFREVMMTLCWEQCLKQNKCPFIGEDLIFLLSSLENENG